MTVQERRVHFVKTFETSPILLLQGSVGDRIKRQFTHQDPPRPLRLAGLYYSREGRRGLETAFRDYLSIAARYDLPLVLHPYTSALTGAALYGTAAEGRDVCRDNLDFCAALTAEYPTLKNKVFLGTTLGFSGDAYRPETGLPEEEAYEYHSRLTRLLEHSRLDHARTGISPCLPEAAGAARALSETTLPYFVSFLVRKDGRLLDGTWLDEAIRMIDEKTAARPPLFYQVNCVHPLNMIACLEQPQNRTERVRTRFLGLEGNGSPLSPEELDNSPVNCSTPPEEWADDMMRLYSEYGCKLLGGCCGTDHAHLEALAQRVRAVWDRQAARQKG